jgi:hypothetical protein
VAAGGYFWLFFDSLRHYGVKGAGRQLWGVAVDIAPDGHYTADPSHPAFYLPGQEYGTGIDCCGGYCYTERAAELADPVGSCTPRMTSGCAKRDERCAHDTDCCVPAAAEPPNLCIGGFCAYVPPPDWFKLVQLYL